MQHVKEIIHPLFFIIPHLFIYKNNFEYCVTIHLCLVTEKKNFIICATVLLFTFGAEITLFKQCMNKITQKKYQLFKYETDERQGRAGGQETNTEQHGITYTR